MSSSFDLRLGQVFTPDERAKLEAYARAVGVPVAEAVRLATMLVIEGAIACADRARSERESYPGGVLSRVEWERRNRS